MSNADLVQELKTRLQIQDVIARTHPLRSAGNDKFQCIEHDSLKVDGAKQLFHWWSQDGHEKAAGDVLSWISFHRYGRCKPTDIEFIEVLKEACALAGMCLDDYSKGNEDAVGRAAVRRAREDILACFVAVAENNWTPETYVQAKQRKSYLTPEIIKLWRLGVAPTRKQCNAAGITDKELRAVGLLCDPAGGDGPDARQSWMHFAGSIIIPYFEHGRVVYLSDRLLNDNVKRKAGKAKTMRAPVKDGSGGMPKPPGFNLGALSGPDAKRKGVLLVEGALDAIACEINGQSAMAMIGTLSDALAKRLRSVNVPLFLGMDGTPDVDQAKRCEAAGKIGTHCRVCVLPAGKDPDDLSAAELSTVIGEARPVLNEWLALIQNLECNREAQKAKLAIFAQYLKQWTGDNPALAGEIRAAVCQARKLSEAEYRAWLKLDPPPPAAVSNEHSAPPQASAKAQGESVEFDEYADENEAHEDEDGKPKKKGAPRPDYQALAREYFKKLSIGEPGAECRMRYHREEFSRWNGRYSLIQSRPDLEADVTGFLQRLYSTKRRVSTTLIKNVIKNLEGLAHVPELNAPPVWLEENGVMPRATPAPNCVCVNNGIFDIDKALAGQPDALVSHTPRFFTYVCLPYDYSPQATCPRWMAFLEQMFPETDVQNLLQEWFGYCLTWDTSQGKFLILAGMGANGKSVVCAGLRAVLGETNISAVPLEAFNPQRTFPLAATVNKLANIVSDMSEVDRSAEGVLKQFADGERMTIERKNRDSVDIKPTARLVFATNILPRFADRSDGLWRKMLLVQCNVQILDETKQDKRLNTVGYWEQSGELSGIFNWAVDGLKRLRARGHFHEAAACIQAKAEFKRDSNPAATFLKENCRVNEQTDTGSKMLYEAYGEWCQENGHGRKLASNNFAKEVRRCFPHAQLSSNRHWVYSKRNGVNVDGTAKGEKSSIWSGFKLLDSEDLEVGGDVVEEVDAVTKGELVQA